LSILFTLTVIANFAVRAFAEPPAWVTYSPLPFLFLLLFSGLSICLCYRTREGVKPPVRRTS
jgi:hypothetical protein